MEDESSEEDLAPVEMEVSFCPMCLEAITDKNRVVLPCLHNFDRTCIERWLKTCKSCPLCNVPRLRKDQPNNLTCPLKGCSKRLNQKTWKTHMAKRHKLQQCRKCNDMFLSHLRDKHVRSECSNRLISCPASGCKEKIPLHTSIAAMENPKILVNDHGCTELYHCGECDEIFVDVDHLGAHSRKCNGGSSKRKRRASALKCEVNFEWTKKMKKTNFLRGIDPLTMGPRALKTAIEDFKKIEAEKNEITDGSWAANI